VRFIFSEIFRYFLQKRENAQAVVPMVQPAARSFFRDNYLFAGEIAQQDSSASCLKENASGAIHEGAQPGLWTTDAR
jgi:hypothetical protein